MKKQDKNVVLSELAQKWLKCYSCVGIDEFNKFADKSNLDTFLSVRDVIFKQEISNDDMIFIKKSLEDLYVFANKINTDFSTSLKDFILICELCYNKDNFAIISKEIVGIVAFIPRTYGDVHLHLPMVDEENNDIKSPSTLSVDHKRAEKEQKEEATRKIIESQNKILSAEKNKKTDEYYKHFASVLSKIEDDQIFFSNNSEGVRFYTLAGNDIPIIEKRSVSSDGILELDKNIGSVSSSAPSEFTEYLTNSQVVVCTKYEMTKGFSGGVAAVKLNNKWGFIDKKDKMVVPLIYSEVKSFSEGLAPVRIGKKWGCINKQGEVVIPAIYNDVKEFHEGLAAVSINNKYGFINTNGELKIALKYTDATIFSEGLAAVNINNEEWIYINTNGDQAFHSGFKNIIKGCIQWHIYSEPSYFINGIAYIKHIYRYSEKSDLFQGYMLFDQNGNGIGSYSYREVKIFDNGLIKVKDKVGSYTVEYNAGMSVPGQKVYDIEKKGCINKDGKVVLPIEYDEIHDFCNGYAVVKKNNKLGLIDESGNISLNVEYSNLRNLKDGHVKFTGPNFWGISKDSAIDSTRIRKIKSSNKLSSILFIASKISYVLLIIFVFIYSLYVMPTWEYNEPYDWDSLPGNLLFLQIAIPLIAFIFSLSWKYKSKMIMLWLFVLISISLMLIGYYTSMPFLYGMSALASYLGIPMFCLLGKNS